jgi:hypothetical protein
VPRAQDLPCLLHEEDAGSLPSFLPADKLPIDASPLRTVPDRMDEAFFVLTAEKEVVYRNASASSRRDIRTRT